MALATAAALMAVLSPASAAADEPTGLFATPIGTPWLAAPDSLVDPGTWSERHRQAIEAQEADAQARRNWRHSAQAREARERSRTSYRDLTPRAASDLLRESYGGLLANLEPPGSRLAREGGIRKFLSDYSAQVKSPDGPALLQASLPLRKQDAEGGTRPVELTLVDAGDAYVPRNSFVPVRLPKRLASGIAAGPAVTTTHPESGSATHDSEAVAVDATQRLYPEVARDTDLIAAPVEDGVEAMWQLRSPESPETYALRIELPPGAELEARPHGRVEMVSGEQSWGEISAPKALDAQGQELPVTAEVTGRDRVVFTLRHRDADIAYPALLDPTESYYWYGIPCTGLCPDMVVRQWDWRYDTNLPNQIHGYPICPVFGCPPVLGVPWPNGFMTAAQPDYWYWAGDFGQHAYDTQGATTYIYEAFFARLWFDWAGGCCNGATGFAGLWNTAGNWSAYSSSAAPYSDRYTGHMSGSPGTRSAVVGETFNSKALRGSWTNHYTGQAYLELRDTDIPAVAATVTNAGQASGGWFQHGAVNIAATYSDPSLGIWEAGVSTPAGGGGLSTFVPCEGTKAKPCPSVFAFDHTIATQNLKEGIGTVSAFAKDAAGQRGEQPLTVKVDRSGPAVSLSGSLYDHRDRELTEQDSYALSVDATDGTYGTTDPAQKRSGVQQIEIEVDGQTKQTRTQSGCTGQACPTTNPNCSADNCALSTSWSFRPADYSDGEHAVSVVVTDRAGNRAVRAIKPLYVHSTPQPTLPEQLQAVAAELGIADESYEKIASPRPDLIPVWRGALDSTKGEFGSGFATSADGAHIAQGDGKVFVAAKGKGIEVFDADEPAITPSSTISGADGSGGIAYYHGELYAVADHPARIDVYRAEDGQKVRTIGASPCRDASGDTLTDATGRVTCDTELFALRRPQGIDAAWGKLYVADELPESGDRVVRVFSAKLGTPLGISSLGDKQTAFRDLSTAPEQSLYLDGKRASTTFAGAGLPWLNSASDPFLNVDGSRSSAVQGSYTSTSGILAGSATSAIDWCACTGLRGTDWVWGMDWFMALVDGGKRVDEFGPSLYKRSFSRSAWNTSPMSDLVYRKREERLEATGDLMTTQKWLNYNQELFYIASDADIYTVGAKGEHWLEQARNFDHLGLTVDGEAVQFSVKSPTPGAQFDPPGPTSTRPAGTLRLDTSTVKKLADSEPDNSGKGHHLVLTAYFTNRGPLTVENSDLWLDHRAPTGRVDPLPQYVRQTVKVTGDLQDAHSGPKSWTPEAVPVDAQGNATGPARRLRQVVTNDQGQPEKRDCVIAAPGPYECHWDTTEFDDGRYQVRAQLADAEDDERANTSATASVGTMVDNTPPTFSQPSPAVGSSYGEVLNGVNTRSLMYHSDSGSGLAQTTIEYNTATDGSDSGEWKPAEAPPAAGEGNDATVWNTRDVSPGLHRVRATTSDNAGNQRVSHYQVSQVPATCPLKGYQTDAEGNARPIYRCYAGIDVGDYRYVEGTPFFVAHGGRASVLPPQHASRKSGFSFLGVSLGSTLKNTIEGGPTDDCARDNSLETQEGSGHWTASGALTDANGVSVNPCYATVSDETPTPSGEPRVRPKNWRYQAVLHSDGNAYLSIQGRVRASVGPPGYWFDQLGAGISFQGENDVPGRYLQGEYSKAWYRGRTAPGWKVPGDHGDEVSKWHWQYFPDDGFGYETKFYTGAKSNPYRQHDYFCVEATSNNCHVPSP